MAFNGKERRKYVRVAEPLPVKFRLLNRANTEVLLEWRACRTRDISTGGVCIEIDDVDAELRGTLEKNSVIFELEICLSEEAKVKAKGSAYFVKVLGESIWNNYGKEKIEVGIKFIDLTEENENFISEFIVQQYLEKYWK